MRKNLIMGTVAMVIMALTACAGFTGLNLTKNQTVTDLARIRAATYTVVAVGYYEMAPGKGQIIIQSGRGVVFKKDGREAFLTLRHIVSLPARIMVNRFGFIMEKKEQKFFLFHNWTETVKLRYKWSKNIQAVGGLVDKEFYKNLLKNFQRNSTLEVVKVDILKGHSLVDEPIRFKVKGVPDPLTEDYLATKEVRLGQGVLIWGNPYASRESLREGIVGSTDWFYVKLRRKIKEFFVVSFTVAHGDSGSPVMATINGRLRVVGFATLSFPRYPHQGVIYKINPYLKRLGL